MPPPRSVALGTGLSALGLSAAVLAIGVRLMNPTHVPGWVVAVVLAIGAGMFAINVWYLAAIVPGMKIEAEIFVDGADVFIEVENLRADDWFLARILAVERAKEDPDLPWNCDWEGWREDYRFLAKNKKGRIHFGRMHPFGSASQDAIQLGQFEIATTESPVVVQIPIIAGEHWMQSWHSKTFEIHVRIYSRQKEQHHDLRFKIGQSAEPGSGPRIKQIAGFK